MVTYGKIIEKNKPKKNTHFMLISKILLILTMCAYYALQILIFIPLLGIMNSTDSFEFNWVVIGILLVAAVVLGIATLVFAILGAVKREKNNTMVTIIVKSMLIPFFCINLYCWYCLLSGLMNPFLFITIPLVFIIGVAVTYVFTLSTGLPDVIYMIIYLKREKKRPQKLMLAGLILCFCFVLDLVGIVLIHRSYKELEDKI